MPTKENKPYANDKDRLANKPDELPTEEFKVRAAKMEENRKAVKDIHTAGSTSFAQIRNELQQQNPNKEPPTKADLYIATQKRTEGRTYKATDEHVKAKIARIENIRSLASENNVMVDQVLSGDSSQGGSRLLGKGAKYVSKKDPKLKPPADLVDELKASLRKEVKQEVNDEMNKKIALMMNHLVRLNPGLNFNMDMISDALVDSPPLSNNVSNEDIGDETDDDE